MNDAIEAAKKAQLVVKTMSMDQREKIITCIRKKIKENAEVLALSLIHISSGRKQDPSSSVPQTGAG